MRLYGYRYKWRGVNTVADSQPRSDVSAAGFFMEGDLQAQVFARVLKSRENGADAALLRRVAAVRAAILPMWRSSPFTYTSSAQVYVNGIRSIFWGLRFVILEKAFASCCHIAHALRKRVVFQLFQHGFNAHRPLCRSSLVQLPSCPARRGSCSLLPRRRLLPG